MNTNNDVGIFMKNAVQYRNKIGPVDFGVLYSFGEKSGNTSDNSILAIGGAYTGPVTVSLSYEFMKDQATGNKNVEHTGVGFAVPFGDFTFKSNYLNAKNSGSDGVRTSEVDSWGLGTDYRWSPTNIATVAYYREIGYLPEALINYLCRLGWSMDGESEFIPLDKLIANFSLERVTDAPGNYDAKKLFWLQGEYMKLVPTAEKLERCLPFLRRAKLIGETCDDATRAKLTRVIDAAGDRIKLFSDVLAFAAPILKDEIEYDGFAMQKAFADAKNPNARVLLREFAEVLRGCDPFDAVTTDKALHDFATVKEVKPNAVVTPVRVAVTGSSVGFGLFDTLAILGKAVSLQRIESTLQ